MGNVKGVDELGDGVGVLVGLLSDIANNVLELLLLDRAVASTCAAGDDGSNQVPQNPGARGLNGVDVGGREEHVQNGLAGTLEVEQGEEGPVDKHGPVVKLSSGVVEESGVDALTNILKLVNGRLPVCGQDFGSKLSPGCSGNLVVVGGENAELVEHIGGRAILAASELELSEIVQSIHHFEGNLCIFSISNN